MKENEEAAKLIQWIHRNPAIWELVCGDGGNEFTIGECIDITENLISAGMYPFALILLARLGSCAYLDEAVDTVIGNRIAGLSLETGILTEAAREMKKTGRQKDILENKAGF